MDVPPHLTHGQYDAVQITLVDCPGHASLIRTIIGGAQIIDLMMLIVDVGKGIQTQTAECLVVRARPHAAVPGAVLARLPAR
eukprot:2400936-Prymnesium_polylepis.1